MWTTWIYLAYIVKMNKLSKYSVTANSFFFSSIAAISQFYFILKKETSVWCSLI